MHKRDARFDSLPLLNEKGPNKLNTLSNKMISGTLGSNNIEGCKKRIIVKKAREFRGTFLNRATVRLISTRSEVSIYY